MSKVIVFIPRTSRQEAQDFIDANNVEFSVIGWRYGVPDEPVKDPERGVLLSPSGERPTTHVMLVGDFTRSQAIALRDNITGCAVYNGLKWTERRAVVDQGLRPVNVDEAATPHQFVMPEMFKIWDIADAPIDLGICVQSPKWDGYTCGLQYNNGELVRGVTQGDGEGGRLRTGRLSLIAPTTVGRPDRFQVEGEVITNTNDPADAYYAMEYATRREFLALEPKFLAFNARGAAVNSWTQAITWLNNQGFDTVLSHVDDDYPKDGIVYRIDNRADENAADVGMFALKY